MRVFLRKNVRRSTPSRSCLSFSILSFCLSAGVSATNYAIVYDQRNYSSWSPQLWPIKAIMTVGVFLMLLQTISTFFKDVAEARGKPIA